MPLTAASPTRSGKSLKGFQGRVPAQIQEGHSDMFSVVKRPIIKIAALEARHELVIGHAAPRFIGLFGRSRENDALQKVAERQAFHANARL
ncbi:MAG: hypothetical protein ABSH24_08320 [Bryobacteraceae bacterium]